MKYILLTSLYDEKDSNRLKEYLKCLDYHKANEYIEEIVIFYEETNGNVKQYLVDTTIIIIDRRPTFRDFFNYCNEHYRVGQRCIITNADIFFHPNRSLNLLEDIDLTNKVLTVTRYNQAKQIKLPHPSITLETEYGILKTQNNNGCSIDTWIFQCPITLDFKADYMLGTVRCDSSLNHQLKISKTYEPYNPCLDFISIHEHQGWHPDKYKLVKDIDNKQYSLKEFDKLNYGRKDFYARIPFCKINKIKNTYKKIALL